MKRKVIALTAACALSLGALATLNAQDSAANESGEHRPGEMARPWRSPLDRLSEKLNLTADQKTKVQPIVDQARPQIRAIHDDAMQKTKAVMDDTMAKIRPLLTAEQQQKLDTMQQTHQDMHKRHKDQSPPNDQ